MKRTYIKPECIAHKIDITPILNASYGDGYADKNGKVLSKRYETFLFEDDLDDEEDE